MKVWIDGALVEAVDARISPFDHGLLTGDGVFETLRVYEGVPFAWRRHVERLSHSAEAMGLDVPDPALLREAARAVIEAGALSSARLRITVTGGDAPLGSSRAETPERAIVAVGPLGEVLSRIDVTTVPWSRNEHGALAGLKTISYGENVRALAEADRRGAAEAIFRNTQGNLCEGTATNVFLVERERVITPPLSAGCLAGVTRELVLELCTGAGIAAVEEDRPIGALADADEAFLTSTTREVQPIAHVDGRPLPAAPGPVTATLADAFRTLVARDLDP